MQLALFLNEFLLAFRDDQKFIERNLMSWEKLLRRDLISVAKYLPNYEDHEISTIIDLITKLDANVQAFREPKLEVSVKGIFAKNVEKIVFPSGTLAYETNEEPEAKSLLDYNLVIHNLFTLLAVFGRDAYPAITAPSVLSQIQQALLNTFEVEELTKRSLDLMVEIQLFLRYSNLQGFYLQLIKAEELQTGIVRRLKEVKEVRETSRKKLREQVVFVLQREDGPSTRKQIVENEIQEGGLLPDIKLEYASESHKNGRTLYIFFQNDEKAKIEGIAGSNLYDTLRGRALDYIGTDFIWISMAEWKQVSEEKKKSILLSHLR